MKDRISLAVFFCAIGLIIGSLATLRLPLAVGTIVGSIIVLACLAEQGGWFRRHRPVKRPLPRSSSANNAQRPVKKVKKA